MRLSARVIFVPVACGAMFLAGCSTTSETTPTTFVQPVAHQKPAKPFTATSVTINGKSVAVPREEYNPTRPIDPNTDEGQQVIIAPDGVLPLQLYVPSPCTITWTNLTTKPVKILFSYQGAGQKSPWIAPGGKYSFVVHGGSSIPYVTSNRYTGLVAVDAQPMAPIPTTTLPAGS